MRFTPLEQRLMTIAEPVIQDLGFTLVCAKMTSEDNSQILQIMAENPETKRLGVDDAAKISRALSAIFDVEDPIKSAYRLEVSSPGIDRMLITLEDFKEYEGFEVKLEMDMPNEDGQKRFRGVLGVLDGETVKITTDRGPADIPFSALVKAKLILTDDLIKKTDTKTTTTTNTKTSGDT